MRIHSAILSRIQILSGLQLTQQNLPQESRFTVSANRQTFSIRVAIMPTITGSKITMRLIDTSKAPPSLAQIGAQAQHQDTINQHVQAKDGLIIVTGPGGSGKSTTLFSLLMLLNSPQRNIITIEDPVEYEIPGANQIQVNDRLGLTYSTALHEALRQDADIIMVGEISDGKTAHLVARSAVSGHLTFSTLPTNDALSVMPHLLNLGLSPYLISSSLRLIIAQRLVPKMCQSCKKAKAVPAKHKMTIQRQLKGLSRDYVKDVQLPKKLTLFESTGCPACRERKTQGQIALFEVVPIFSELRYAINNKEPYETLVSLARRKGFLSLRQDGTIKALQGLVRYEDMLHATSQSMT